MGKMTSIIRFTGRVGNLIGYEVNGKLRVRSAPEQVRQSPATKRSSRDFGTASAHAAVLRHGIAKDIIMYHDKTFLNRLNKAMVSVVKADVQHRAGRRQVSVDNLKMLEGMRINKHCGINCNYDVQRLNNGQLSVTVSQPLAQFHGKVHHMQFRAVAVFPDFDRGTSSVVSSEVVTLSDQQTPDAFCLTIPATERGACVVILEAISCVIENGQPRHMGFRRHNAMDIIAVLPPAAKRITRSSFSGTNRKSMATAAGKPSGTGAITSPATSTPLPGTGNAHARIPLTEPG